MLLTYLSLALIAILSPLTSASPTLLPRAETCSNAPSVVAGSPFTRRSSLPPRDDKRFHWCIHGTSTYLTLQPIGPLINVALDVFITNAYNSVYAHLASAGDGLIPSGSWRFQVDDLLLLVDNANNHQVSWGVLASAVWGLRDFMHGMNFWGVVVFSVYEGVNLVGQGRVAHVRRGRGGG